MALTSITPMLTVPDVAAAVAFYRDRLGFDCLNEMPGWACTARDGVEIMFALPNVHLPFDRPAFTGSIYFRTTDVDTLWSEFKDRAEVLYPLEEFDYGMREFAIRDLNGYILQFGEPME